MTDDTDDDMTLAELVANLRDTIQLVRQGTRGSSDSQVWLTVSDLERLLDAVKVPS